MILPNFYWANIIVCYSENKIINKMAYSYLLVIGSTKINIKIDLHTCITGETNDASTYSHSIEPPAAGPP